MGEREESLERLARRVSDLMAERYPCARCGDCCHQDEILVRDDEVPRLASRLGMDEVSFKERHLVESDGKLVMRDAYPCPFLGEGGCSVYDDRPGVCRMFPYRTAWFQEAVYELMRTGSSRRLPIREGCPCGEDLVRRINATVREVVLDEMDLTQGPSRRWPRTTPRR